MKAYILYELNLFIKNPKNKLMFLMLSTFLLIIGFFIFFRDTGNIEHTQYRQMNLNRIAISTISENIGDNPEQSELYGKLYDQQQLVASQDVAIRFEEDSWFVDSGLDLAQLQIDMHNSNGLDNLDDELRVIVPSLHQAETNQAFLAYMDEESFPLLRNREHAAGFLITFFDSFGVSSFVFLLLFTCSILSTDRVHKSMVEGYPLSYEQKTASKVMIYTIACFVTMVLLTVSFTGIIGVISGAGPLDYPMVMYQTNQYRAVPLSSYTLRYGFYILVLAMHVSTLSALLNTLTKNMYATLFSGLILFVIPFLVQVENPLWRWIPLHYYQVSSVLSGESAYLTGQSQMAYGYGIVVLLLWSAVFAAIIYLYGQLVSIDNDNDSRNLARYSG
ncbi:hypothetical protein [Alkalibacterium olivapovliticus]|uniref:ABC-2 type transport system permease protein n=1 Tax=Alkalibacterium olivapovliticus TaxID=99907 RepID=A0A2T0W495_9LACT|nr:hypothetical protein [Alkalibacterium olivapovliticus]PRY80092.1 hypothetical protein CLV38_12228 [Alkalibacterium olivapovliticus]